MGGGWSFIRKVAPNGGWTVFIDADSLLKLSVVYAYIIICWLLVISDTMEARYLYNYAQSLELLDDDPLNNPESSLMDSC